MADVVRGGEDAVRVVLARPESTVARPRAEAEGERSEGQDGDPHHEPASRLS